MYTCEFTGNDSSSKSIAIYNSLRRWIIEQHEFRYSGEFKDWLVSRNEHNAKDLRDTIYEEHFEEIKQAITKDLILVAIRECTGESVANKNEQDYYDILPYKLKERIFREVAKRIINKKKLNAVILEMVEPDTQKAIDRLERLENNVKKIEIILHDEFEDSNF